MDPPRPTIETESGQSQRDEAGPSILEEENENIWFDRVPSSEQQGRLTNRNCACGCFQKMMLGERSADLIRMIEKAATLHPAGQTLDRSMPKATKASRKRVAAENERRTKYNSEEFEAFAKEFYRKNLKIVDTYELHLSWSCRTSAASEGALASCDVSGLSLCYSAGTLF
jgi:hypothetical protein